MTKQINFLTLNVNGLNNDTNNTRLMLELGMQRANSKQLSKQCDVIFIQEHHLKQTLIQKRRQEWLDIGGSEAFFAPALLGNSGQGRAGVAIMLGSKGLVSIKANTTPRVLIEGRALLLEAEAFGKTIYLLSTYAPNNEKERRNFFEILDNITPTDHPIIWGGDHNCVEDPLLDRSPPRNTLEYGATQIKIFKTKRDLIDPFRDQFPYKQLFTHTHNMTDQRTSHHRIDRIYIPTKWSTNSKPKFIPFQQCDHKGFKVSICLEAKFRKKGPGLFRLNLQLLRIPQYVSEVREIVAAASHKCICPCTCPCTCPNTGTCICICTCACTCKTYRWECFKLDVKSHGKKWGKKLQISQRLDHQTALRRLDDEQQKPQPNQDTILQLTTELLEIEKKVVDKLILLTQTEKLDQDELPTPYFYSSLRSRYKKSTIDEVYITDDPINDPRTTKDPMKILTHIHAYYKNLYSGHTDEISEQAMDDILGKNLPKIPQNISDTLERQLTVEELKAAGKSMKNNKSPGQDGIPVEFLNFFADDVYPMLLEAAEESFCNTDMGKTQKTAMITLIFKDKGERKDLGNWRPISLLCCDYKVIAKALAMRLAPALNFIIHPDQTCGVPGRTISNNTWLLRDLIDLATERQDVSILFSLDLEKAFDRVSHKFIEKCLEAFGFGPHFQNWIKTFYHG